MKTSPAPPDAAAERKTPRAACLPEEFLVKAWEGRRWTPYFAREASDEQEGDYENQGGVWGGQPPFGDHFFFAHMAWHAVRASGDDSLLNRDIRGRSLLDRLELAFDVAPSREDTDLVWCDDENRGVAFGSCDSIIHTGELLFPSVLQYRAACPLASFRALGW